MRTANPTLNSKTFAGTGYTGAEAMTIGGTVNKVGLLLLLLLIPAAWVWNRALTAWDPKEVTPIVMGGVIGGLIFALVTIFKKEWAPITAPLYAVMQGLYLGGISAWMHTRFDGIVIQAVALTFGVLFVLLAAYRTGLIKATENFRLGIVAATGAIFVVYLVSLAVNLFGGQMPYIHSGGTIGILFSLFVVTIAALNLVLDFDFIEKGSEVGAPKYMEWYAAFGLMVTLVWLYIEILRLLAKLQSRD